MVLNFQKILNPEQGRLSIYKPKDIHAEYQTIRNSILQTFETASLDNELLNIFDINRNFTVERIDTTAQFELDKDIKEFYLKALQRGSFPRGEFTPYDKKNKKKRSELIQKTYPKGSVYLISGKYIENGDFEWNKRVTLNYYDKHEDIKKDLNKYSNSEILRAKKILRIETQLYKNILSEKDLYSILKEHKKIGKLALKFFESVGFRGDYYKLKTAEEIVKEKTRGRKKERLLTTLEMLNGNNKESIWRIQELMNRGEGDFCISKEDFNKSLKDLDSLGINPLCLTKSKFKEEPLPNLGKKIKEYYNI